MVKSMEFQLQQVKVIVKENATLYTFTLLDEINGELYQSQECQLKKISMETIRAAFAPNISAVQYHLKRLQNQEICLVFQVKLEYLTQKISQNFILKKKPFNKGALNEFQNHSLRKQVEKLDDLLTFLGKEKQLQCQDKINCLINPQDTLWTFQLNRGKYLIEIDLVTILQKFYNGLYEDEYYQEYDCDGVMAQTKNLDYLVTVQLGQEIFKEFQVRTVCYDVFQYPFNLKFLVNNKKEQVTYKIFIKSKTLETIRIILGTLVINTLEHLP